MRCVHESTLHVENAFLTLTYDEKNLPRDSGLNKTHFQKFIKRYRKYLNGKKIRYYHCGEYGETTNRPHYHAIIFGHDFSDKEYFRETPNKDRLYTSNTLANLWTHGNCLIGNVTFESAAYVARYIMKKVKYSKESDEKYKLHYSRTDPETGEFFEVQPEYTTMSRRPGIGQGWYEKFGKETYRDDFIITNGSKCQPPKYYDEQYLDIATIKQTRRRKAIARSADNTPERLNVKEKCKQAQISSLKRNLQEA